MEKKLYELEVNSSLATVMPQLQELELNLLAKSLMEEGCRDPLVTWNGVIVDGHNRYRICREHQIPFNFIETEFEDVSDAKKWIIRNQLARRNVPDFVRCELVLPLEEELKAEAERRRKKAISTFRQTGETVPNLAPSKPPKVRDEMAQMAGVSHGTIGMVKKIVSDADEDTKEQLRDGKMSIYKAYTNLKKDSDGATRTPEMKADDSQDKLEHSGQAKPADPDETDESDELDELEPLEMRTEPKASPVKKTGDLVPGFGVEQILSAADMGTYVRPDDSVYDIPPIEVYGNMPSNDMVLRSRAEMAHAQAELRSATERYVRRVGEILRGMSMALTNDEDLNALMEIVTDGCNHIREYIEDNR